ncbi:MAG: hypothetical protein PVH88_20765 [Ignavibacteria bacterium]|jgi:hypothetical protein
MNKVARLLAVFPMLFLLTGCPPDIQEFSGRVPANTGGAVTFNNLEVFVPEGVSSNDIEFSILEQYEFPEIAMLDEQIELLEDSYLASPVYKVSSNQETFPKPITVKLKIDPEKLNGIKYDEDIFICRVKNGIIELKEITYFDLESGTVFIQTEGFSNLLALVAKYSRVLKFVSYTGAAVIAWEGLNLYYAHKMYKNELKAWEYVEPNHPSIENFIKVNNLKIPDKAAASDEFKLINYNKKFDIKGWQYLHPWDFTGMKGSEVLNANSVTCWDVTNFFTSILYSLDTPDLNGKIKLVKGLINGVRHSWAEVVIDGKAFVVDTYGGAGEFRFVERDAYYESHNLVPTRMYTKDANSIKDYNKDWCKDLLYASNDIEARMKWLKDRHRELQVELNDLAAEGELLTASEVARMDAIRKEQKKLYQEYIDLRNKLQRGN